MAFMAAGQVGTCRGEFTWLGNHLRGCRDHWGTTGQAREGSAWATPVIRWAAKDRTSPLRWS